MASYTELAFYRNNQVPLVGRVQNDMFWWQGSAATANCVQFPAQALKPLGATIVSAFWRLCWNPVADGSNKMGVRVIRFSPNYPSDTEICRIENSVDNHPINQIVDVTNALRAALDAGEYWEFGHQTYGNATNGCNIWLSQLEVLWG